MKQFRAFEFHGYSVRPNVVRRRVTRSFGLRPRDLLERHRIRSPVTPAVKARGSVRVPGMGTSPYASNSSSTKKFNGSEAIKPTTETIINTNDAIAIRLRMRPSMYRTRRCTRGDIRIASTSGA